MRNKWKHNVETRKHETTGAGQSSEDFYFSLFLLIFIILTTTTPHEFYSLTRCQSLVWAVAVESQQDNVCFFSTGSHLSHKMDGKSQECLSAFQKDQLNKNVTEKTESRGKEVRTRCRTLSLYRRDVILFFAALSTRRVRHQNYLLGPKELRALRMSEELRSEIRWRGVHVMEKEYNNKDAVQESF